MTIRERLEEIDNELKKLEEDKSNLHRFWAQEIKAEMDKPKFDMYSKKGEKLLVKVSDKYTPLIIDIDEKSEELIDEYNYLVKKLENLEENN